MPNIFDLITPADAALYFETLQTNRIPYLGETLFPEQQITSFRMDWIKGQEQPIRVLQPSALDTKPMLRERPTLGMVTTFLPFFRESARMGEYDQQQIMMFQAMNAGRNNPFVTEFIDRYFMDTAGIIESAYVNPEIMRMQLMSTGSTQIASVPESGQLVNWQYNYDPNGTWATANNVTLTGTAVWSDHVNSNPMQDVLDAKVRARARGTELTRMIVGYETYMDIALNERIKLAMNMNVTAAQNAFVTPDEVANFFAAKTGVSIAMYDKSFVGPSPDDDTYFFYPQRGCATLLPSGTLGRTIRGTTPEEAQLMGNVRTTAQVAIVGQGIAVSTDIEALPVNSKFWVSTFVLPSFENMDRVFNIKYTAAP